MKILVVFFMCSLINVILSTMKTLLMVRAGRNSAIAINAICYGFYTLVVKQLASVDYVTAVVVTVITNIIGVWLSYKVLDMFKKDKLWRITVHLKKTTDVKSCCEKLDNYNIGYSVLGDSPNIDIYSYSQEQSEIIKSILRNYKYKYFIQEMNNKL